MLYLETKDQDLFAALYRKFHEPLLTVAFKVLHGDSMAEDIVNDVFTGLMSTAPPEIPIRNVRSFLCAQVRYKATDYLRHMNSGVERGSVSLDRLLAADANYSDDLSDIAQHEFNFTCLPVNDEDEAAAQLENEETWAAVADRLDDLDPRQRRAVELYYGQALTRLEVAEVMGISPDAAWMLIRRGIARLRNSLAPNAWSDRA